MWLGKRKIGFLDGLGFIILLVVWTLASLVLSPVRLPNPYLVVHSFFVSLTNLPELSYLGRNGGYLTDLIYSTVRTIVGAAIGILLGTAFGLLLARSRVLLDLFRLPFEMIRITPSLAAVPFLLMWFGPNTIVEVGLVAAYCFLNLTVNVLNAVLNVPEYFLNYALCLGATKSQVFRKVVLPAIVPEIIGGARVCLALSWGLTIVGEMMGANYGIGKVFSMLTTFMATEVVISGTLWLLFIALAADQVFKLAAYRFTRWIA